MECEKRDASSRAAGQGHISPAALAAARRRGSGFSKTREPKTSASLSLVTQYDLYTKEDQMRAQVPMELGRHIASRSSIASWNL